jgi:hypothetical protein
MEEQELQQTGNPPAPEGLLYHYTDQKGLLGIIEGGCLRATHYRFLNDIEERREAIRYFSNVLFQRKSYKPTTGIASSVREHVLSEVQRNLDKELQSVDAYFVCFTQENMNPELPPDAQMLGDRLSQWRGYAQGRQGFSLGFQRDRLISAADELPKTNISVQLLNCTYSDLEKDAAAGTFVGYGDQEVLSWGKKGPDGNINNLSQMKRVFHQFSSRFKHIGFKEETEWRLAFHMLAGHADAGLLKFRDGRFGVTPYIEVPLRLKDCESPLKRIVVGPGPHKDDCVASVKMLLASKGIQLKSKEFPEGVDVVSSQIPYRN